RRHTRSKRDWSSDVCSSDLHRQACAPWPSIPDLLLACSKYSAGYNGRSKKPASHAPRGHTYLANCGSHQHWLLANPSGAKYSRRAKGPSGEGQETLNGSQLLALHGDWGKKSE